jgi:hypothetical protein
MPPMSRRSLAFAVLVAVVGAAAYAACVPHAKDDAGPAADERRGDAPAAAAPVRAADAVAASTSKTAPPEEAKPLAAGHALAGSVRTFDGRALPGAVVRARPVPVFPNAPDARKPVETTADASGAFALHGLDAGDWALAVCAEGAVRTHVATVRVPDRERFDLVLPRGGVVDGTVLDETTHAPVLGARVRLLSWRLVGDTRTGDGGRFSIAFFADLGDRPKFLLDAEGFTATPSDASVAAIDTVSLGRHEVTLFAQHGRTLTGRVVGPDGPVAGAKVEIWGGGVQRETTSDRSGAYSFDHVDAHSFAVGAKAAGLVQESNADPDIVEPDSEEGASTGEPPASGPWTAPDVIMRRRVPLGTCRIEGRVVLDDEQHPVAGAVVRTLQGARSVSTTTADDGTYVLAAVPTDGVREVAVVAEHDGYVRSGPYMQSAIPGSTETDAGMLLEPFRHVRGHVTGPGGAPVAEARVVVVTTNRNAMVDEVEPDQQETHAAEGRSGPDGAFDVAFPSLRHDFALVVDAPGFGRAVVEKGEDAVLDAPIDVALVASRAVAGRAVLAGTETGAAGLDVSVTRAGESAFGFASPPFFPRVVATTAADGSFRVEGLAPGEGIRVGGAGWLDADVPEDSLAAADLRIEMRRALEITGRAQFADGVPCAGVEVSLVEEVAEPKDGDETPQIEPLVQHVRGAADGSFVCAPLHPARYRLAFRGGTPQVIEHEVGAFDAGAHDLRFELVRGSAIRGRVTAPDGAAAKDVEIVARAGDDSRPNGAARTDAAGSFEVGGLDRGEYVVTVKSKGCFTWTRSGVRGDGDPLVVRLDAGLAISGVVLDEDGRPRCATRLLVESVETETPGEPQRCETDSDGRFRVTALTRGRWRVRVDPEWPFGALPDTVVEAGAASLELRLLPPKAPDQPK